MYMCVYIYMFTYIYIYAYPTPSCSAHTLLSTGSFLNMSLIVSCMRACVRGSQTGVCVKEKQVTHRVCVLVCCVRV